MTSAMLEDRGLSDVELVAASRQGNREAFGRIVRKYQAMITGLIYASCGDLHRSEDLAQETFISAWKSLTGLREAAKLPAWLCQIARHRLLDQSRSSARENARLTNAFRMSETRTAPPPEAEMLSQEERDLLWRTLSSIEQPYRETLVLYYRQDRSAAAVAEAMETTEVNVRQRLARGREMLREQVAGMLERNLARSTPKAAFTTAVVAALPALGVQSAKAATLGAAGAKGAASLGLLSAFLMWVGPVVGVGGGILGMRAGIRAAETPRERRFVIRSGIVLWIFILASIAALFWSSSLFHNPKWSKNAALTVQIAMWAAYMVILAAFIVAKDRKHRWVRQTEGLDPAPQSPELSGVHGVWAVIGSTAGATCWMFAFALQAGDWVAAGMMCIVVNALIGVGLYVIRGKTAPAMARYLIIQCALLGVFTTTVVNLRLHAWIASIHGISLAEARQRLPFGVINLYLAVFCIGIESVVIVIALIQRSRQTR